MTITKLGTLGIVKEIKQLHELALEDAKRSIERAIRIGELLTEQKSLMQHGDWIPWVEENLPFGRYQAVKYMKIYEGKDKLLSNVERVPHLPMREAVKLLSTPKEEPEPVKTTYRVEEPEEEETEDVIVAESETFEGPVKIDESKLTGDSYNLQQLKHFWKRSSKSDKKHFKTWIGAKSCNGKKK